LKKTGSEIFCVIDFSDSFSLVTSVRALIFLLKVSGERIADKYLGSSPHAGFG